MPTQGGVDIADLLQALDGCCDDLAALLESTPGAAASGSDDGLRWTSLTLGDLPLVDQIASIVRPPLQVIMTILQVIAAILDALAVIVAGLLDPFKALILAAYEAVKAIIDDILNAGVYVFPDAPGVTSPSTTGRGLDLVAEFKAGQTGGRPSPPAPNGFDLWATHFRASFDDPGDEQRPIFSDRAAISAVFILGSAPNGAALRQVAYLLGNLLQLDAFKEALDRYNPDAEDPEQAQADTESVAPDWYSRKMQDLFPALRELEKIPEALKGLLLAAEGLSQVLAGLADAIREKAAVLGSLVAAIDAVLAMLEALKDAGLHALPVTTTEGPDALYQAFLDAKDRPEGEYVAGVCLLAGGPGFKDPAGLWELLGVADAFAAADAEIEKIQAGATEAFDAGIDEAREVAGDDPFLNALIDAPVALIEATGHSLDALLQAAADHRNELVDWLEDAIDVVGTDPVSDALLDGIDATRSAQRRGVRSLALGLGAGPPSLPPFGVDR